MQPTPNTFTKKIIAVALVLAIIFIGIVISSKIFGFSVPFLPWLAIDQNLDKISDKNTSSLSSENEDPKNLSGAKFASLTRIDEGAEYMRMIDTENSFYKIHAAYPYEPLDKDHLMRDYVEYAVGEKIEEWKVGGTLYNSEQEINQDFPNRTPTQYELNTTYKKYISEKQNTVTYVFTTYEFTGGAHGNSAVSTFTFGLDDRKKTDKGEVSVGKPISIQDILSFENGNDITLSQMLAKKLPAVLGDYAQEEMIENGLGLTYLKADGKTFDAEKCHCDGFFFGSNLQNFILADDGLVIILGQYQVAPYVSGMPEVKFSWKELEPFLNSEFKSSYKK